MRREWRSMVVAAVLLWCAAPAAAADDPVHLPLRLSDLPSGYRVGDDSGCGLTLTDEGAPEVLVEIARHHRAHECGMQFERLWRTGGPALVESEVFVFDDATGASAGLDAAQALIGYAAGLDPASLAPLALGESPGDAGVAFATDDAVVLGRPRRPGAIVLWRAGAVLSYVLVAGRAHAGPEQAMALARIQQSRIAAPTPLAPADNDDSLVALDHPRLGVPVYWLGPSLDPPGSLPLLVLDDTSGPFGPRNGPGWRLRVDYDGGVTLGVWRRRTFARFARTELGRLVGGQRCARSEELTVPAGRAVVVAGYERPPDRCGRRRDRFVAYLHARDAVVTVNVPLCLRCGPRGDDPYDTRAGMHAILRALSRRP